MPRRSHHPAQRLATQTMELSLAAPQVIAHRMARMATAGFPLSARDTKEFTLMGQEKVNAFYQSWAAMWTHSLQMQMQMAQEMMAANMAMAMGTPPSLASLHKHLPVAATRLMSTGLAPVHSKAVANAKRLNRSRIK